MSTSDSRLGASVIFIAGSSRSGTTLMSRLLGASPDVYSFRELHFFERLWDPSSPRLLPRDEASVLAARVIHVARTGILGVGEGAASHVTPAHVLESQSASAEVDVVRLFEDILIAHAAENGARLACEQTPANAFVLGDILTLFPACRVVALVRDPRDVLLSQRKKWRVQRTDGPPIPRKEAVRALLNYHPRTAALLWRSATANILRYHGDPRVIIVRFEDLVLDPQGTLGRICKHVGIAFLPEMLLPEQRGSSIEPNASGRGFSASAVSRWKTQLTSGEVRLCERIARTEMGLLGYDLSGGSPVQSYMYDLLWPLHAVFAALGNIGRISNARESVLRRFRARKPA